MIQTGKEKAQAGIITPSLLLFPTCLSPPQRDHLLDRPLRCGGPPQLPFLLQV